jgi:polysaccharide biosynthesis transport protein
MDARNNDFPLRSEYNYTSDPSAESSLRIMDILGTLRREWRFPMFGCLIGLTLGLTYIAFAPTLYRSSARILLDRSVTKYLQTNKIADDPTYDEAEIASQVYVLSSESVATPVVRSMNLTHDAEFVGLPGGDGFIRKMKGRVKGIIGWGDHAAATDPDAALEETAVENFLKRMSVYREEIANVINVTFASEDPKKAADIANAIADTYITITLETKLKATKMVGQWLQDRLTELKAQATDADIALQHYKIANNLVTNGSSNSEKLTSLNSQLSNAQVATAEAKARLDDARRQIASEGGLNLAMLDNLGNVQSSFKTPTVSYALSNTDILKLRSQYRDSAAKAAELEASVGSGHIAVIKLRKKLDELRKSIQDEEQRIVESYDNEYQIAKKRESELSANVAHLIGEVGTSSQAQVKMRELESSADTLRNLYNSFLQKYKEINTLQTETIPVQNARILTRAAPLGKSSKKKLAMLAGGIMVGLFLGAGAAVGREWVAGVFRSPRAVEETTGITCIVLPTVQPNRERMASHEAGGKSILLEEFVLDAPYSRFAEMLRKLKALMNAGQLGDGVKVIGVVSSVPKEGKTTVAANLAALIIASSGARTLIIDSDVHLRNLTTRLAPDAREGLIEALVDPSRLPALVSRRRRSGLDVLPCALSTRLPNAGELLGSREMGELLAVARKAYDYIVIEVAPIMSVVDLKMIERFIDKFIFVVEWGQTKRSLVLEALSEAEIIHERLVGIVLNKVDPVSLRMIEAYKGARFGDYYQE